MPQNIIGRTVERTLKQPEKTLKLTVNGQQRSVVSPPDTPLLYVLHNDLQLNAPRFGCGLGQCGACTVHLDGKPIRSCITPVGNAVGHKITTLEGLAATHEKGGALHPVQQAWIEEDAILCGYCQPGQIMAAVDLLARKPHPSDKDIDGIGNLCRCGSYPRIRSAIKRASKAMRDKSR